MKLPKLKVRRNTIVKHKEGTFYGRVIRVLEDGKVLWLCCGLHFRIDSVDDLDIGGYKGYNNYRTGRFIHMTSLRWLKIRAKAYHFEYAHNTPLNYHFISRG